MGWRRWGCDIEGECRRFLVRPRGRKGFVQFSRCHFLWRAVAETGLAPLGQRKRATGQFFPFLHLFIVTCSPVSGSCCHLGSLQRYCAHNVVWEALGIEAIPPCRVCIPSSRTAHCLPFNLLTNQHASWRAKGPNDPLRHYTMRTTF